METPQEKITETPQDTTISWQDEISNATNNLFNSLADIIHPQYFFTPTFPKHTAISTARQLLNRYIRQMQSHPRIKQPLLVFGTITQGEERPHAHLFIALAKEQPAIMTPGRYRRLKSIMAASQIAWRPHGKQARSLCQYITDQEGLINYATRPWNIPTPRNDIQQHETYLFNRRLIERQVKRTAAPTPDLSWWLQRSKEATQTKTLYVHLPSLLGPPPDTQDRIWIPVRQENSQ